MRRKSKPDPNMLRRTDLLIYLTAMGAAVAFVALITWL